MNVLLISQCDKRALTETRRILDQFAERRGDRTWQTPITQDGLDTLRRLLRKTARKNTAVACHWIRGIDHSELLWVVGDRRRFNEQGAVPTNTTRRNVLRSADENQLHSGELIRLLADMAGLMHDLGKATEAFQARLCGQLEGRNLIRHEWVSLRLLEAFVGSDDDATWLGRLACPSAEDDARWRRELRCDGLRGHFDSPFKTLQNAPLASALGWLVVTHHRLPALPKSREENDRFQMSRLRGLLTQVQPDWNEQAFDQAEPAAFAPYWHFPQGLPVSSAAWRRRASRIAGRLADWRARQPGEPAADSLLNNPFVMHLSRLSLMLADHHYSRLQGDSAERVKGDADHPLWANTLEGGRPNQRLDEHLLGVAQHGSEVARFLPRLATHLPRLGAHKGLRQRTRDERFRWQDKSAELAAALRERAQQHGAFLVNMASTGCGKTLANARIMYALADPTQGLRCAFALGLRTLTLQTGQSFRAMLGLGDDDLAIRVGGSANRALFEFFEGLAEARGSASGQALLEEDSHVLFEGATDQHPLLRRAVADPEVSKLLLAPLLVCTIDHLTPATESQRGGRQIAPMLRLMSGDLVLDEPDDFDLADLPALTRLVHWAGLLGARVLLSSATLPPALIQGLFEAYRNGRHHFQRNCGAHPGGADIPPVVCCAWVDEFNQQAQDCPDPASFGRAHAQFAQQRHTELARLAAQPRRRAALLSAPKPPQPGAKDIATLAAVWAPAMLAAAASLHQQHHSVDPVSGHRVSFGLVRMANIEPLFEVALALFRQPVPPGCRVHLCVYHSRHPLLIRSAIEQQLDRTLNRHDPSAVFSLSDIRQRLDTAPELDQLFIVLGSPVTEVGRDHDYDWALVEPSSMRSLIQLAGRVRRHRRGAVESPNLLVFDHNLRHFREPGRAAFRRPGFETDGPAFHLSTHDLHALLRPEELAAIDARPRIVPPPVLQAQQRLVDLEHARLHKHMLPSVAPAHTPAGGLMSRARSQAATTPPALELNASTWWHAAPQDATLTAVLQRAQPFRQEPSPPDVTLVLLPDEDGDDVLLHRVIEGPKRGQNLYVPIDRSLHHRVPDDAVRGDRMEVWGTTDYLGALADLALALDLPLDSCAKRFGTVAVPGDQQEEGWRYHPALGFAKRR
ncbi:type I-F CRISPR-associated helicase Cas3 [Ideonella sp. 4Y11]|uniref:Type I-F CRISPR-associated helicase Cas3 n=1 Tax=Ideonella aquatica TaxID=2824119 RepID=A0A941BLK9_9BURK|nr:type I-F CRISPR-associated helicase Cas3f [Ideonella aquatica]MBQ0959804.1 type I-F CRISPR-associated helicase Cas3 [Ideonella aquatica]